jgi:DNA-binding CsgD family transcriptional regulator
MSQRITTFLEQLAQADTLESLEILVLSTASLFDVDHATYHSVSIGAEIFALSSYSSHWMDYYVNERLGAIDPVVLSAFQKFEPYEWKSLDWSSKASRQLLLDASEAGVGSQGISFPIRGPNGEQALFTINHTTTDAKWERFVERERYNLLLVAHYIHENTRRVLARHDGHMAIKLSPREVDSLTLLGLGQNRAGVAEALSISEHTLRVYIESSRIKLGANNTTHAVARAMAQGLITI